nr:RNA-directed DNA polymerase, eukaryota [Tanacetum cinerariifolium]
VMFEFTTEEVKKKFQSCTTISSWFSQIQQATCDFTTDGRVSWVEIEEVPGWVPNFVEDTDDEDESDDDDEGEPKGVMLGDSDVEAVPDTMFEVLPNANGGDAPSVGNKEMHSEDPFNIYDLLKSAKRKDSTQEKDEGIQNIPEDDVSSEVRKSDLKIHDKENDFNEVRNKTERFGSVFNAQGANAFNTFISSSGLAEVPLDGCSFMWFHKLATKMSKLDRFMISESLMSSCLNILAISLDRFLSVHHPILLREFMLDYGPTPFRFFHYWIEVDEFVKMVEDTWNVALAHLDALIDNGEGTEATVQKRTTLVDPILKDEKLHSMEVTQKAKIKWAIEGDENSKFYHGILNNKRNQLSIRGVLVDGIWIENPSLVKTEFLNHFKSQFKKPSQDQLYIDMEFPRKLSSTQQADLEIDVSNEEIKKAV